jgi:type II restriction enzyme
MNIFLNQNLATGYKSKSQVSGILTEAWVHNEIFCPACGSLISHFEKNRPVADFYCDDCKEEYELKSKKDKMGKRILDGAYETMIERLKSENNPNFFFLNYNVENYTVENFMVIPKHFFTPEIIIKRNKGLIDRPSYIMCSIDLTQIPQSGKIFYIKNKKVEAKKEILENWQKTLFLREEKELASKGWILDTMNCIDKIGKKEFSLDEVYSFEKELKEKHPENNFIKDKLRQQLQVLRDKGYLEFVSRGRYKLAI